MAKEMKRLKEHEQALRTLGFEIDPMTFTIDVCGRKVYVEEIVDKGLPQAIGRLLNDGN